MFLLPVSCNVGVEMSLHAVCDRARADIHSGCQQRFLAREPGPLTSSTTVAVRMRCIHVALVKPIMLLVAVHGHQRLVNQSQW